MNIYKLKNLFVCLLFVACSGKSGAKVQDEKVGAVYAESADSDSEKVLVDLQMIYATDADREIFEKYLEHIEAFDSFLESELIIETARFFMDKPYVAHTLEIEPEGLVVNLREFDCTTFVETVLALSRTVFIKNQPLFEDFCNQLLNIRYRRGTITDYTSRIHYFSDWIYENETRGHVTDITKNVGGVSYSVNVNYMSGHSDSYKQLKSNEKYVEVIKKQEAVISARDVYSYIPEEKIKVCEQGMRNGDIVCFVTDIEGLDISHTGFVYYEKDVVTFIHASSTAKKVIANPQPITGYVEKNKSVKGLMIVRPQSWK
jgi:Protein of unknown function (DUF1460).